MTETNGLLREILRDLGLGYVLAFGIGSGPHPGELRLRTFARLLAFHSVGV